MRYGACEGNVIYAVQILRQQYVKIGYSSNDDVQKRIAELQTGSPFQITPLFTTEGTLRQEQAIHSVLRAVFAQVFVPMPPNEWYPGRNPVFERFLRELRQGGANHALAHGESMTALHNPKGVHQGTPERHNLIAKIKWAHKADPKGVRAEPWMQTAPLVDQQPASQPTQ